MMGAMAGVLGASCLGSFSHPPPRWGSLPAAEMGQGLSLPCKLGIHIPSVSYSSHPWNCCTRTGLCPALGTSPVPQCPLLLPQGQRESPALPHRPGSMINAV